ncbi:hypothetical protein L208DRAFT_1483606 [Tricholoma matsutake]|nr:hypothetical protein L208DRAFT_1483606 [Tricholoma matsutake 945]
MFDRAFTHGVLGPWNLTECHGPSIEVSNCYFTPVRQGLALASAPFQENVDPCGVLAKMVLQQHLDDFHQELVSHFVFITTHSILDHFA